MGRIERLKSGHTVELSTETLIGRSPRCRVVLDHPLTSSLHAQIRWMGTEWFLSDVSRNGTWINGQPHRRDDSVALRANDAICFGRNQDPWLLRDASAPNSLLIPMNGSSPISLGEGPVALPPAGQALVSVFLDPDGGAIAESAKERRVLIDGSELEVSGVVYQVQLASPQPPTAVAGATLEHSRLTLAPAAHEEHVSVTLTIAGKEHQLRPRVHFSLLLELARERLGDRQRGVSSTGEGWVHMEEVCKRLNIDRPTLNTYAHRLRKQFDKTDLTDAVNIVERRADSDEVRLGCSEVVILKPTC